MLMKNIKKDTMHLSERINQLRKVRLDLRECTPGMKIAETLYNKFGAMIISENTILDSHTIRKLEKLNIQSIEAYRDSKKNILSNSFEAFKTQYTGNLMLIKDILFEVSKGKNIDTSKINYITDSIMQKSNENRNVLRCINQIYDIAEYEYTHSINVAMLSMLISRWLGHDDQRTRAIVKAGLLHDLGKSRVQHGILGKRDTLLPDEFSEVKKHVIHGYDIIKNIASITPDMRMGILMHHEREDGSGYPLGLKSERIHEYAKIIAVADVYDAMTSNRAYRQNETPFNVFEIMETGGMCGLSPKITMNFLQNIASYYIGDMFFLSSGEICEIIFINSNRISKPLIRIRDRYVDLSKDNTLRLDRMV